VFKNSGLTNVLAPGKEKNDRREENYVMSSFSLANVIRVISSRRMKCGCALHVVWYRIVVGIPEREH